MELVFLLALLPVAHSVKHSLTYFVTASSGLGTLPELVAVSVVDGVEVGYCDSHDKRAEFRQDWVQELNEDDPPHVQWHTQTCVGAQQDLKALTESLKQHFNQTGGMHILQELSTCEWDDETEKDDGVQHYGYDGEDFVSFDLKMQKWLYTEHAASFKDKWDPNSARLDFNHLFFTQFCPQWLKKYLIYGRSSLQRKVPPSVSLLQKSPSSPVSCHATGFYPNKAEMFWRKDGEELHEDVDHGEILPNHDGTFQTSVDLNISAVGREDWPQYECVFQLYGSMVNTVISLEEAAVRTNWTPPSEFPAAAVGAVVGLLLLAICVSGLFIWWKKKKGYRPANTSDSLSPNNNSAPN